MLLEVRGLKYSVAQLKADAATIEATEHLESQKLGRSAELDFLRKQNELEIAKAKELSNIEVRKLSQMVGALGKGTILRWQSLVQIPRFYQKFRLGVKVEHRGKTYKKNSSHSGEVAESYARQTPTQKQVTFNDTPEIAELNIDLRPQFDGTTSELSIGLGAVSPSKLKKATDKDRHSKTAEEAFQKSRMLNSCGRVKAMKYAERISRFVHVNVTPNISSPEALSTIVSHTNDCTSLRLTRQDDELFEEFEKAFKDLKIDVINTEDINVKEQKRLGEIFVTNLRTK
eukprot:Em0013g818a